MNTQTHQPSLVNSRKYYLDWLRVIAFASLIFYHIGMLYSENWGFHFKSNYTSQYIEYLMLVFSPWRMLLIWFISGVALRFMIDKVSGFKSWLLLTLTRSIFLLLPLLVGLWLIVPLQLFAEMSQQGVINISYWQFYLAFIETNNTLFINYQSGVWPNVDVNHLWYLRSLWQFMLIIIVLTFFARLPFIAPLKVFVKGCVSFGLLITLLIVAVLFTRHYLTGDSIRETNGLILLLAGYILAKNTYFWNCLNKNLVVLALSFAILFVLIILSYQKAFTLPHFILSGSYNIQRVVGVFFVLALAHRFLNFNTYYLKQLNAWVFPFYLLHQSILIILCFLLQPLSLGSVAEPFIIILGTWFFCGAFTWGITRVDVFRPFLGVAIKREYSSTVKTIGYTAALILITPLAYKLIT
ncbi:acyltransferase family protein [Pseudoalteromonas sp. MMG007]|uniref:acyltransferase family protein n=1 Tax=Pseudoalteromonas sp. MMG007 TaxID=2822684 RepID=UPI001B38B407|nr:acyltransferase family protein [Pseudoalteromonas sp. MMG007]MBQ4859859.1 acyltransferase family protein [Pseudoalteromonas sp. MMG007]